MEAAGRMEDVEKIKEEFDSVATLAEAFLANVGHLEPCETMNLVGEGGKAAQKQRAVQAAEVKAVEMKEQDQARGQQQVNQLQQMQQQMQQLLQMQQAQQQAAQQQQASQFQSFALAGAGGAQQRQEQIWDDPEEDAFARRLEIMAFAQNPFQQRQQGQKSALTPEKLQHLKFNPPAPKQNPQATNERCVLCRAHLRRDSSGREQQCWRYPDVITPTAVACPNCPNCFHPPSLCRRGIPLTDLYVGAGLEDPRADRVPNASWPHANPAQGQKQE